MYRFDKLVNMVKTSCSMSNFSTSVSVCSRKSFLHAVMLMCSGRKVAIDASMSIYQFLIAVRQDGSTLTNAEGETTRFVYIVFYIG